MGARVYAVEVVVVVLVLLVVLVVGVVVEVEADITVMINGFKMVFLASFC